VGTRLSMPRFRSRAPILQSGGLAGEVEGMVLTFGLLCTTFARGEDSIMVPNNIVLTAAVVPLREPSPVDLRARLRPDARARDTGVRVVAGRWSQAR
jgi:hypothetical protein